MDRWLHSCISFHLPADVDLQARLSKIFLLLPDRIAAHACMEYIHNPGVPGRFYGPNLQKEMVVLENKWDDDCRFELLR